MARVMAIAGFGALIALAVVTYNQGAHSTFVQADGLPDTGLVQQVNNIRLKSSWTAEITVALTRPVGDAATTVVHFPDKSSLHEGWTVSVLLDPDNPTYAEFPGTPSAGRHAWLAPTVFACIVGPVVAVVAFRRFPHVPNGDTPGAGNDRD